MSVALNPESPHTQYPRNPLPPPGRLSGLAAGEHLVEHGVDAARRGQALADLAGGVAVRRAGGHLLGGEGVADIGRAAGAEVQVATLRQNPHQIRRGNHENPHLAFDLVGTPDGALGRDADAIDPGVELGAGEAVAAATGAGGVHELARDLDRPGVSGEHHEGGETEKNRGMEHDDSETSCGE